MRTTWRLTTTTSLSSKQCAITKHTCKLVFILGLCLTCLRQSLDSHIERLRRVLIPIYAIAIFTPTIVKELGYSAANAQLLTVPPFVAGCFFTIIVGIYSDKYKLRGPVIIGGAFVSLIGYIVLYTQKAAGAGYAGAILAAVGVFPTIAVALAWVGGNAGGDLKRGVVIAMVVGLGNLGGYVSHISLQKLTS